MPPSPLRAAEAFCFGWRVFGESREKPAEYLRVGVRRLGMFCKEDLNRKEREGLAKNPKKSGDSALMKSI